jgi:hypothetical protein
MTPPAKSTTIGVCSLFFGGMHERFCLLASQPPRQKGPAPVELSGTSRPSSASPTPAPRGAGHRFQGRSARPPIAGSDGIPPYPRLRQPTARPSRFDLGMPSLLGYEHGLPPETCSPTSNRGCVRRVIYLKSRRPPRRNAVGVIAAALCFFHAGLCGLWPREPGGRPVL